MQCHDVTHDVTAPPDDVTSENKRCTLEVVCPKCMNTELPKMPTKTQDRDHLDHWVVCLMPHPPPHIWAHPCNRSLQPLYLHYITTLCIYRYTNLQKQGRGGPRDLPAQSSSTSDSRAFTSTAVSCGDPGSCGVKCTGEQPPTVASESDHGSSKARGSS